MSTSQKHKQLTVLCNEALGKKKKKKRTLLNSRELTFSWKSTDLLEKIYTKFVCICGEKEEKKIGLYNFQENAIIYVKVIKQAIVKNYATLQNMHIYFCQSEI